MYDIRQGAILARAGKKQIDKPRGIPFINLCTSQEAVPPYGVIVCDDATTSGYVLRGYKPGDLGLLNSTYFVLINGGSAVEYGQTGLAQIDAPFIARIDPAELVRQYDGTFGSIPRKLQTFHPVYGEWFLRGYDNGGYVNSPFVLAGPSEVEWPIDDNGGSQGLFGGRYPMFMPPSFSHVHTLSNTEDVYTPNGTGGYIKNDDFSTNELSTYSPCIGFYPDFDSSGRIGYKRPDYDRTEYEVQVSASYTLTWQNGTPGTTRQGLMQLQLIGPTMDPSFRQTAYDIDGQDTTVRMTISGHANWQASNVNNPEVFVINHEWSGDEDVGSNLSITVNTLQVTIHGIGLTGQIMPPEGLIGTEPSGSVDPPTSEV